MKVFSLICSISRAKWSLHRLCQCVGLTMVVFAMTPWVFAANSADHTFTDQQGRSLVAQIVRVAEPDVYLQCADEEPFEVKIGVFIAKDQSYIQQWALDNQKTTDPFVIFALRNVLSDSTGGVPEQEFEVTLKNVSGSDVTNLQVDYVVLRQPAAGAPAPLPRINGKTQIASIAKNMETSFATDQIQAKGNRLAVWVRIYNSSGTLLQEWSSSDELTKNEKWDSTTIGSPVRSDGDELRSVGTIHVASR
jgi:hypothetical protein